MVEYCLKHVIYASQKVPPGGVIVRNVDCIAFPRKWVGTVIVQLEAVFSTSFNYSHILVTMYSSI